MKERKILFEFETTAEDGRDNIAADVLAKYVVYEVPEAASGLVVAGWTTDGREVINPCSLRPLIRRLLQENELNRKSSDDWMDAHDEILIKLKDANGVIEKQKNKNYEQTS